MSHVASVNLVITDLEALKAACKDLGLTFVPNQKTHAWYGRWVNDYDQEDAAYIQSGIKTEDYGKCEHAIKVPGSDYEIGVYKNPKGQGFVLAYDFYGPGRVILEKLGKGLEKLKQAYATSLTMAHAKKMGWMTQKTVLPNGTVKLQLSGM